MNLSGEPEVIKGKMIVCITVKIHQACLWKFEVSTWCWKFRFEVSVLNWSFKWEYQLCNGFAKFKFGNFSIINDKSGTKNIPTLFWKISQTGIFKIRLNFSWKIGILKLEMKLRVKLQRQVETWNLQGHVWCILTVILEKFRPNWLGDLQAERDNACGLSNKS